MPNYIDDGYTRGDGYIAASPANQAGERLWGALEFSYRLPTRSEWIRHDAEVKIALRNEDQDPECAIKGEELACKFVAEHVKDWNLKNRGGHAVPVSADACMRLNGSLFKALYYILREARLSDLKPTAKEIPPTSTDLAKNLPVGCI